MTQNQKKGVISAFSTRPTDPQVTELLGTHDFVLAASPGAAWRGVFQQLLMLEKLSPRIACWVMIPNHDSTWLIQEALVGI